MVSTRTHDVFCDIEFCLIPHSTSASAKWHSGATGSTKNQPAFGCSNLEQTLTVPKLPQWLRTHLGDLTLFPIRVRTVVLETCRRGVYEPLTSLPGDSHTLAGAYPDHAVSQIPMANSGQQIFPALPAQERLTRVVLSVRWQKQT